MKAFGEINMNLAEANESETILKYKGKLNKNLTYKLLYLLRLSRFLIWAIQSMPLSLLDCYHKITVHVGIKKKEETKMIRIPITEKLLI